MISIKQSLLFQLHDMPKKIISELKEYHPYTFENTNTITIDHTKNIFNYIIDSNKSDQVINFITRKLLTNNTKESSIFLPNNTKFSSCNEEAKENLKIITNSSIKPNNAFDNIIASKNSPERKLLSLMELFANKYTDYDIFSSKERLEEFQLEITEYLKHGKANADSVINLFESMVKKLTEQESLVLEMFNKTALNYGMSLSNNTDDFFKFLSLGCCWLMRLKSSTTILSYKLSCVFDAFILLSIKNIGFDPWEILSLSDYDFDKFCHINRLLIPCAHIHYYKLPDWLFNSFFLSSDFQVIYKYICLFLAKIEPLLWDDKALFEKYNKPNIEILPYKLLLATFNIFPEIIASSIYQLGMDNQQQFRFNKKLCFFGEEFEFNHKYNKYYISNENIEEIFASWKKQFILDVSQKEINNFSINRYSKFKYIYNIGGWSYTLFRDFNNLEINTTPYLNDDKFTISLNNKDTEYNAYDLFDKFIHTMINKLNYKGVSGHKHFDARSLNGNTELLLRIIIDFETNSWLPAAINRLDSEKEFFSYLKKDDFKTILIKNLVDIANEKIKDNNYTSKYGDFNDIAYFAKLFGYLCIFGKNAPCNLYHLKEYDDTPDLIKSPKTTVEFRMFHCPRNGYESFLLNNLIIARINYLLSLQIKKVPISYKPTDPFSYAGDKYAIINEFNKFIIETGLKLEDYKPILHII